MPPKKKKKDDEPPDPDGMKCHFCERVFTSEYAANRHIGNRVCKESRGITQEPQEQDSPQLTCSECNAGPFSRAQGLARHIRYIYCTSGLVCVLIISRLLVTGLLFKTSVDFLSFITGLFSLSTFPNFFTFTALCIFPSFITSYFVQLLTIKQAKQGQTS